MTFAGHVQNGVVNFEGAGIVPDGTKVTIRIEEAPALTTASPDSTLGQRLSWLVGAIPDLLADFASEHEHYIHYTEDRP